MEQTIKRAAPVGWIVAVVLLAFVAAATAVGAWFFWQRAGAAEGVRQTVVNSILVRLSDDANFRSPAGQAELAFLQGLGQSLQEGSTVAPLELGRFEFGRASALRSAGLQAEAEQSAAAAGDLYKQAGKGEALASWKQWADAANGAQSMIAEGKRNDAGAALQATLDAAAALTAIDPDSAPFQSAVLLASISRGNVATTNKDDAAAKSAYEKATAAAQKLSTLASNPSIQIALHTASIRLGDLALKAKDNAAAKAQFLSALQASRKLGQHDVWFALVKTAFAEAEANELDAARTHLEEALKLANGKDLALTNQRMGDVALKAGDKAGAKTYHAAAVEALEQVAANSPADRREVIRAVYRLADIELSNKDMAAAEASYEKGIGIARQIATEEPANIQPRRDLIEAYLKVGAISEQGGDTAAAKVNYTSAATMREQIVALDPNNLGAQFALASDYERLGRATGDKSWYAKALPLIDKAHAGGVLNDEGKQLRDKIHAAAKGP